jgi:hypothetical protein
MSGARTPTGAHGRGAAAATRTLCTTPPPHPRYGISGKLQTTKIGMLSDGQKSRIVFGMLCMKPHNLLLLDGGWRWGAGGGW